jgi:16S rRNA C967 or C1407 C5-methylase (RsmB/RsmF family)/NOL1/NOP2/fmu family ribosome biogenesis protein
LETSLPAKLLSAIQDTADYEEILFCDCHAQATIPISIRLHPIKKMGAATYLPIDKKIPWSTNGFYLKERPSFTLDPLLHAGCYYVQEASSMFLEQALRQTVDLSAPLKVLDLCAAPGGKSTHLLSLISNESILVSNEVISNRNSILEENISKWGIPNVVVTQNEAKDFAKLENYFDAIIIDAPCSGSGLFRKDPNAIKEWSLQNVNLCSQRQQKIIASVLPALKKGGVLIYSTCSYSPEENEHIMDWMTENFSLQNLPLAIEDYWGITTTPSTQNNIGYRFWPYKALGEGFFISCFKKEDGEEDFIPPKKTKALEKVTNNTVAILKNSLKDSTVPIFWMQHKEHILALPTIVQEQLPILKEHLYVKLAGVNIGSIAKNQLLPTQELALSTFIKTNYPTLELDYEDAIAYLQKEVFVVNNSNIGIQLVTYHNVPLGFIKNLGNRINNYYPKNWRILMKGG